MKKLTTMMTLLIGLAMTTQTQYYTSKDDGYGGGLFRRGMVSDEYYYGANINQPSLLNNNYLSGLPGHDSNSDQPAPIGSGALLLVGFGVMYAKIKKGEKNNSLKS